MNFLPRPASQGLMKSHASVIFLWQQLQRRVVNAMSTTLLEAAPSPAFRPLPAAETERSCRTATRSRSVGVSVEFCQLSHYARVVDRLRSAVEAEFPGRDLAWELHAASGGLFEVRVDGRLVFSKRASRRLPRPEEVFYHVGAALR